MSTAIRGSLSIAQNVPQKIKDELIAIEVLMDLMRDKYTSNFKVYRWGDTLRHTFEYKEDNQYENIITLTVNMDGDTYDFLGLTLIQYHNVNKEFELNYKYHKPEEVIQVFKDII